MDKLQAIVARLGQKELETLLFLVEKAEPCGSQHLAWLHTPGSSEQTIKLLDCEMELKLIDLETRRASMEALATLQFLSYYLAAGPGMGSSQNHLTLFSAAFERVEHERRNQLGKWWERTYLQYKDLMGVAAFFLSILLVIIEIIRLFVDSR